MLQKARRYVDSAEALAARHDYDSAASRLYYTMYCAEALLWTRGQSFSRHRAVIASAREFVQPGLLPAELHQSLRLGFEKKTGADYEFSGGVTEGDVANLTAEAKQFLQQTAELLNREGHL